MKKVLDRHGILFISDEVQTGWGRTGENFWGYQAHGIVPDMLTFAKGLGNGMAIGGVIARAEIMDSFTANSISTFGGNPLAMAGALANLDYLLEHDLQTNASKVGRHMKSAIEDMGEKHDIIGEVRGKGLMIGVELGEARHQRTQRRRRAGDPGEGAGGRPAGRQRRPQRQLPENRPTPVVDRSRSRRRHRDIGKGDRGGE